MDPIMNTDAEASTLMLPVTPARDHIRGRGDAPVTLVEYGDFECSFCAVAHGVVDQVRSNLRDNVCFVFRHFPLTSIHPHAELSAEAAEAAAAQGNFWDMHDLLFRNQHCLDTVCLAAYARQLQFDLTDFSTDLGKHRHLPRVREDLTSGARSGVNGTPSFFINNVRHEGSWELGPLLGALQRAMRSSTAR
jgi:protein-disulfide isomerase